MKLLVGCPLVGNPTAGRNWILQSWRGHLLESCEKAGVEPSMIFNVHPDDHETRGLLGTFPEATVLDSQHQGGDSNHKWNQSRYYQMVDLRNELLEGVRAENPDYFFSLDSDVLLHPDTITLLLEAMEEHEDAWAIAPKCFVSKHGTRHPNMGVWVNRQKSMYRRHNYNYLAKVDIVICCYIMRPEAYNIDYVFNSRGEDLGWSMEVVKAGGNLYWDGRVGNKHVMDPRKLDEMDSRVGF